MGNTALKLVDDNFVDEPEYGDGDGGGEVVMACPECDHDEFKLIDDEYHTVMCSNCGTIVGVEWVEDSDIVLEDEDFDPALDQEMRDVYDSLGIKNEE